MTSSQMVEQYVLTANTTLWSAALHAGCHYPHVTGEEAEAQEGKQPALS